MRVDGSDVNPVKSFHIDWFLIPGLTSLPSTLTAKKSMKMKFSADKIYYNFFQENPKITNIENSHRCYRHFKRNPNLYCFSCRKMMLSVPLPSVLFVYYARSMQISAILLRRTWPENFEILLSQLLGSLYSMCRTKRPMPNFCSMVLRWKLRQLRHIGYISSGELCLGSGNKSWYGNVSWQLMWAATTRLTNEVL